MYFGSSQQFKFCAGDGTAKDELCCQNTQLLAIKSEFLWHGDLFSLLY